MKGWQFEPPLSKIFLPPSPPQPYPANIGLSLAWLLAFTKSFALLVNCIVGLLYTLPGDKINQLCD